MTGLEEKRRAIRPLLGLREPADAMAAYYALYHTDQQTTLVLPPTSGGQPPEGYVALSLTGIDLFRPLVTMRLPLDRDSGAMQASADLLRLAVGPGQPVMLSIPDHYLPLIQALFHIDSEERLRLYALEGRQFQPIVNVLVMRGAGWGGLPRFTIRSMANPGETAASATLNWQSPNFAEIAVSTLPSYRRRGWGRSVVAAMCQQVLESGRTPLYQVAEDNIASIQLAESIGFQDTGVREVFLQAALRDTP